MLLLKELGEYTCRGALEEIYKRISRTGSIKKAWASALKMDPELANCVKTALGNNVTPKEAETYIQENLWKRLCDHVHNQASAKQRNERGDALLLPELPIRDKVLVKCILEAYNYRVVESESAKMFD